MPAFVQKVAVVVAPFFLILGVQAQNYLGKKEWCGTSDWVMDPGETRSCCSDGTTDGMQYYIDGGTTTNDNFLAYLSEKGDDGSNYYVADTRCTVTTDSSGTSSCTAQSSKIRCRSCNKAVNSIYVDALCPFADDTDDKNDCYTLPYSTTSDGANRVTCLRVKCTSTAGKCRFNKVQFYTGKRTEIVRALSLAMSSAMALAKPPSPPPSPPSPLSPPPSPSPPPPVDDDSGHTATGIFGIIIAAAVIVAFCVGGYAIWHSCCRKKPPPTMVMLPGQPAMLQSVEMQSFQHPEVRYDVRESPQDTTTMATARQLDISVPQAVPVGVTYCTYCTLCGMTIATGANFCTGCGQAARA